MPNRRSYRALAAVAMAVVLGFASVAADAAEEANPEQTIERAAVEVDGIVLFQVRGTTSFPAEGRAAAIAQRIEAVARDPAIDPASIRTGTSGGTTAIFAGPTRIMVVTPADAQLEQLSVDALVQANEARIRKAIVDYRTARTPERMTRAALLAGGATLLYLVGAALLIWITMRLRERVESVLHARIHTVGIQSFAIVRAERARALVSALLRLAAHPRAAGADLRLAGLCARAIPLDDRRGQRAARPCDRSAGDARARVSGRHSEADLPRHPVLHRPLRPADGPPLLRVGRPRRREARELRARMGDADVQDRPAGHRRPGAGRRVSVYSGVRLRGLQGHIAVPGRRVLARFIDGDLQHHRRVT